MKLGAYDYMAKPYRMAEIDVLVRRAWEKRQLARENALSAGAAVARRRRRRRSITQYAPMHAVLALVERVATSDSPVLITGESGTGKELARARDAPAVRARRARSSTSDCAALAEELLESELFGHERGAFTGADRRASSG